MACLWIPRQSLLHDCFREYSELQRNQPLVASQVPHGRVALLQPRVATVSPVGVPPQRHEAQWQQERLTMQTLARPSTRLLRVLVVDDNAGDRELTIRHLRAEWPFEHDLVID